MLPDPSPSVPPADPPPSPDVPVASEISPSAEGAQRAPIDLARFRKGAEGAAAPPPSPGQKPRPPRRDRLGHGARADQPAGEANETAEEAPRAAGQAETSPEASPPGERKRSRSPRKPREESFAPAAPKVPVPNRRGPLPDDLQAEIDAALGGLSLEDVIAGRAAPDSGGRLENESRHRGQVVELHGDNVFFSLGGKNQGVASLRQFTEPPQVGDVIEVVVTGFNPEDNLHDLSIPGGAIVVGDWSDIAEGSLVEARVTAANTGGLECQVNNIRAFIPASHVGLYRVENLAEFVGQKLVCTVTESNERRGNLVLSRRAVLEREKEELKKKTLAELEVGAMREGVVRRLHDFGAFVDIGGVDGLIHVSQLAWDRVKHPSEVVQEGQKVRVRIEKVDPDTGKISLSLKNPEEHPWTGIEQRFPVGSSATGTVTRIAQFGAFVKLAPGVEGLIHISELAHHKVYKVENVVKEGQEVEVKVVSVDAEAQRMGLSLKALLAAPVKAERKKEETETEVETPPRPLAVPKRSGPLKGGVGKTSGGEQFGLQW
ncbi:MAG TPA: S1 RNA-binding domain-containing protein [Pirellulaceae bacterium]|nr:S1 RNA-binding domain-containing protein [Pirellulaceae bacterium]